MKSVRLLALSLLVLGLLALASASASAQTFGDLPGGCGSTLAPVTDGSAPAPSATPSHGWLGDNAATAFAAAVARWWVPRTATFVQAQAVTPAPRRVASLRANHQPSRSSR